jgi:hypothetical protein
LRKRLLIYNLKHYLVLFVSFYVLIQFGLSGSIFYFLSVIPMFQIVHNMVCKVTYLPDQFDFLYAAAIKTFLFVGPSQQIYLFGFPNNFLEFSTRPLQISLMVVAYCFQVVCPHQYYLLYRQQEYGPDDLLPKLWKAKRFEYLHPVGVLCEETISEDMEDSRVVSSDAEPVCHLHEPPRSQLQQ